ncbi:helix-turn-helix domain-containing protein [Segeticoccus rhizosphaerae]|jgi:transcriptional regulator with XRE-family HTH domain|uniref:helix-turn-helix domain-containing protein n=1 Tax=Segeticoccus rhizosphaerae TaxID=1104777 RepID=UPI0010C06210|nr:MULTISPECIES: helix-turn-helix transcriptional regulator [Intrasporangiaceae]
MSAPDGADDPVLKAFGQFVKTQRQLARVSQRHLARLSGVSDSYLSQLERGRYRPSAQVVTALADAFGLAPKALYAKLGLLPEDDDATRPGVEEAIIDDPRLGQPQKEALIRVYRSYLGDD